MSDFNSDPWTAAPASQQMSSVGYCLVERPTGRIVGYDGTVGNWLAATNEFAAKFTWENLFPDSVETSIDEQFGTERYSIGHFRLRTKDGYEGPARVSIRSLDTASEDLLLAAIRLVDVETPQEVSRDALTGLPDRTQLAFQREQWRQAVLRPVPHALLFVDLDDFKQVNDQLGHLVGDSVLATVANRWQDCLREGDIVVRFGGDEFVILLKGIEGAEQLPPIVNRLRDAVCEPITIDGLEIVIGASIGVAYSPDHSKSLEKLIAEADRDMYASKRRAKDEGSDRSAP